MDYTDYGCIFRSRQAAFAAFEDEVGQADTVAIYVISVCKYLVAKGSGIFLADKDSTLLKIKEYNKFN